MSQFEAPDIIAFADYATSAADFVGELVAGPHSAEKLHLFPYCDGGKLRHMSVLTCADC